MAEKFNKIDILFEGYSHSDADDEAFMRANCTCTLIRTHSGQNLIVDTMNAWDGERIIGALATHDLKPSDINVVVCTHGHADHIGCNYLFSNANWHIVGTCISNRDKFMDWDFKCAYPVEWCGEEVLVQATPGHTLSCVSVLVHNSNLGKVTGICGDLFERQEDITAADVWLSAGSEDCEMQRKQRLIMAELCTFIVPGHGPGFQMTEEQQVKLRQDTEIRE